MPPPAQLALPLPPVEPPPQAIDAWVVRQWRMRPHLHRLYPSPAALLGEPEAAQRWRLCARLALLARQRRRR